MWRVVSCQNYFEWMGGGRYVACGGVSVEQVRERVVREESGHKARACTSDKLNV